MSSDELSCLPNRVEGINSQPATIETNGSGKNSSLLTRQSRIRMNRYVFIFNYFFTTVYILQSQWVQTEIDRATAVSSLRGGGTLFTLRQGACSGHCGPRKTGATAHTSRRNVLEKGFLYPCWRFPVWIPSKLDP